jgi:hypothetical protein
MFFVNDFRGINGNSKERNIITPGGAETVFAAVFNNEVVESIPWKTDLSSNSCAVKVG